MTRAGTALALVFFAAACAGSPAPQVPPLTVARGDGAPPRSNDVSLAVGRREQRIVTAIRAGFPDARKVRVAGWTKEEIRGALRAVDLDVIDAEGRREDDVLLIVASDRTEARMAMVAAAGSPAVVTWIDGVAALARAPNAVHAVTPVTALDEKAPAFEHHVVLGADRAASSRLAVAGLWPWAPGIEISSLREDGTRNVRMLGYVKPSLDPARTTMTFPSSEYAAVGLETPETVAAAMRVLARSERRAMAGPTQELLVDTYRGRTMIDAVGTCGGRWASGAAVAVVGRATVEEAVPGAAIHIDVARIEATVRVETWRALAPRYASAVIAVARAVEGRGSLTIEDFAPLTRFHVELRTAYATTASLLEVDAVLRALDAAFRRGSVIDAIDALGIRCRRTEEEQRLHEVLLALGTDVTGAPCTGARRVAAAHAG